MFTYCVQVWVDLWAFGCVVAMVGMLTRLQLFVGFWCCIRLGLFWCGVYTMFDSGLLFMCLGVR